MFFFLSQTNEQIFPISQMTWEMKLNWGNQIYFRYHKWLEKLSLIEAIKNWVISIKPPVLEEYNFKIFLKNFEVALKFFLKISNGSVIIL